MSASPVAFTAAGTSDDAMASSSLSARNYRILWRWHFYAALFVMPFLLALAVTGTIYVFKPQFDRVMYGDLLFVTPTGTAPLSYAQQVRIATDAVSDQAVLTSMSVSADPRRSTEAVFRLPTADSVSVYINPYNGALLGSLSVQHRFMQQVRQLHRDLMLGTGGGLLMELAACWTLVMIGTGIALWWPRKAFSVWGSLLPRWHLRGRAWWRELHLVIGIWVAIGAVFFILSGLPWSNFWGKNFQNLITANFGAGKKEQAAKSDEHAGHAAAAGNKPEAGRKVRDLPLAEVPWGVAATSVPHSMHEMHAMHMATPAPPLSLNIDQAVAIAAAQGMHTYQLVVPRQDKDVYTASYAPGTSEFLRSDLDQQRTLHIDRYSGVIRKDLRYADFNPVSKMVTLGVALHMGEYFGLVNQLICAAISLSLLGLCMTGFVMWWWRRPRGALGAPQRVLQAPPSLRRWQAYLAALGILFPLMGATMLLVWGGDRLFFGKRT
ncbi:PepSY-associated TM helix domain-containing protein [Herbaspirillum autotrophicum]|uniref:PepSY-associated TM helix domain-containing protein n=1 Tax=Herbaspirillum autotrophicum TaxID=180195 RepID=UPI00067AF65C|nr:PepSY domain-containing protein [Herbaspirillum autotrophicum]